jgi:choloylglycine hydrolase
MCTSFRVIATDGTVVVGRTMEFPNALAARLAVLPRGYQGTGTGQHGDGMKWTSSYGVVGMDAFGQPGTMTDGMNEAGLYAALLYMPGFCEYTPAEGQDPARLMSVIEVVTYVLGASATVETAKEAMRQVTVWPYVFAPFGFVPPAHLVLHDASGHSAVIEWRDGEMVIFDNPIGVACNSPHLGWHLTNLRNYINLSYVNPAPVTIDCVQLGALGQGPGMNGLPGDPSSPSRFLRATAFTAGLRPVADGAEMEKAALHILNNFDIPPGFVRDSDDPANDDHTLWSSIANLGELHYIIRSYDNPTPQLVELKNTDFSGPGTRQIAIPNGSFARLAV